MPSTAPGILRAGAERGWPLRAVPSLATNLVAGDTNNREDIFLHDRDVDADGLFDEAGQIDDAPRVGAERRHPGDVSGAGARRLWCRPDYRGRLQPRRPPGRVQQPCSSSMRGTATAWRTSTCTTSRAAVTTRVSLRPGGAPGAGERPTPIINATDGIVAFMTSDPGMVVVRPNGVDESSPSIAIPTATASSTSSRRLSRTSACRPGGALYTHAVFPVAISDDGRWVAYRSYPTLGIFDRSTGHNALVRDRSAIRRRHRPVHARRPLFRASRVRHERLVRPLDRDPDVNGVFDEPGAVESADRSRIQSDGRARLRTVRCASVFVSCRGDSRGARPCEIFGPAPPPSTTTPTDWTTIRDAGSVWTRRRPPASTAPTATPTATAAPTRRSSWPGRIRAGSRRAISPRARPARSSRRGSRSRTRARRRPRVLLRYQTDTGHTTSTPARRPGPRPPVRRRRRRAESGVGRLLDGHRGRRRRWSSTGRCSGAADYGSHAETSLPAPSTTWYLAEGATHGAFDLFYLLQNPSATTAATSRSGICCRTGAPIVRTYTVAGRRGASPSASTRCPGSRPPTSRRSSRATNAVPIIVERAMYLPEPGHAVRGGPRQRRRHRAGDATGSSPKARPAASSICSSCSPTRRRRRPTCASRICCPIGAPIVRTRTRSPAKSRFDHLGRDARIRRWPTPPVSTVVEIAQRRRHRRRAGDVVAGRPAAGRRRTTRRGDRDRRRAGASPMARSAGTAQHADLFPRLRTPATSRRPSG